MYYKITLFVVSFFTFLSINAQELEPKEGKITYKKDYVECWKVMVDPESNTIKREWKDYVKENLYFKLKGFGLLSNKDVLEAEDVLVEKLSSKRIDFFTRIIEFEGQTEIAVFARQGYDSYFNNDNFKEEFTNLKKVLVDFLKMYLPKYYDEQVDEVSDSIDKLVKNGENLQNRINNNKKTIEELQEENVNLEKEIEENKLNISSSKEEFIKRDEKRDKVKQLLKKI